MTDTTVTLLTPVADSDNESFASAISWPSIFGGALAIAALTVVFVTFGGSLGIARPETGQGMAEMGVMAAIWLVVTQWIASGIGGYLTGRLRTKWAGTHSHEVFFRDTAHGFLAWALALLFGAILLGSVLVNGMDHMHGGAKNAAQMQDGPAAYYVDSLYRTGNGASGSLAAPAPTAPMADSMQAPTPDNGATPGTDTTAPAASASASTVVPVAPPAPAARINPELRMETTRILMRSMGPGGLPDDDKAYLSQLVATHTGLSADEAAKRVDTVTTRMQADMQKAHKAIGYVSLFTALSMLIGAFIASAAAAFGGSQRDEWEEAVRTGTYNPST